MPVILTASHILSFLRHIIKCLFLLLYIFVLQGCPYTTTCVIDTNPQNQVNETYLGNWQGEMLDENGEKRTVKLDINKIDDYYYELLFHGKFFSKSKTKKSLFSFFRKKKKQIYPSEDTIRCSAYASYVTEREVFNVNVQGINYIAEISFKEDKISLLPIAEGFSSKVILSDFELREALEFHYKSHLFPSYDEPFCLRNMSKRNDP